MAKKDTNVITLQEINPKTATISIVGDTDLVLNKMNNYNKKVLTDIREDKDTIIKEKPNMWEQVITSVHWLKGDPEEYSEEIMINDCLPNRIPCITAFGLKKSFGEAVVRNEIDTYATKFNASINVLGKGDNLVPIKFTEWNLDKKLMSPKRGAPVLVYLNRFSGWSADIDVQYLDHVFTLEQIVNIINLAGFGLGIGSGRTSGYGRYHVVDVK